MRNDTKLLNGVVQTANQECNIKCSFIIDIYLLTLHLETFVHKFFIVDASLPSTHHSLRHGFYTFGHKTWQQLLNKRATCHYGVLCDIVIFFVEFHTFLFLDDFDTFCIVHHVINVVVRMILYDLIYFMSFHGDSCRVSARDIVKAFWAQYSVRTLPPFFPSVHTYLAKSKSLLFLITR